MLRTLRTIRFTLFAGLTFFLIKPVLAAESGTVVENGKQVGFLYKLTVDGSVFDSNEGRQPMVYVQGGGQILPALEAQLAGMKVNDRKTVKIAAADAYGEVDPSRIQEVKTEQIPEGARQPGAMLQAQGYPGPIRVVEVKDDVTIVDFNHPLAGKELTFDITIVSIEMPPPPAAPATPENGEAEGMPADSAATPEPAT